MAKSKNPFVEMVMDPEEREYKVWAYFAKWDPAKSWYVRVEIEIDGKLKTKKFSEGINQIPTVRRRKAALLDLYRATINVLAQGADLMGINEVPAIEVPAIEVQPTLEEEIEKALTSTGLREASIGTYRSAISHLLRWAEERGFVLVDQITRERVKDFKAYLQTKVKGHKSINTHLASCSAVFGRMLGDEKPNPFYRFGRLKENNSMRRNIPYRPEHISLIRDYCEEKQEFLQVYMVILGLYNTGLRISELLSLRKEDFDLERGIVYLMGANAKTHGGGIRFSPDYRDTLRDYLKEARDKDHVFGFFGFPSSRPATRNQVSQRFVRIRAALGLDGFGYTLYSARHKVACDMADSGFTLAQISSFLRHTDLRITTRYLRSMGRNVNQEFFNNFPELEG